ncbi:MAG: protein-L-isoaspartate O-methyltransferase [Methanocella sp. PtaU1.Bin125]|nr:MAG: protein-L-isoaspartate O-methyltransferase [Methanocella sp. PtaU1.Bin125]
MHGFCSDIDWNEAWKLAMRGNREAAGVTGCAQFYVSVEEARKYDARSREERRARTSQMIRGMDIRPESRVLDIGAGPGTLALPLAGLAAHVTAVEPSPGMMAVLAEHIRDGNIGNIRCVQKLWEDVDVGRDLEAPYDVVIASFSLGMDDLRAALAKMDAVSSGYVYIYWFAGLPFWERNLAALWETLHGKPYAARPQADCVFNVLYGMGIYPNVEIYSDLHVNRYDSLEDAVRDQKKSFSVSSAGQETALREFLRGRLRAEDGKLVLKGASKYAKLWWKK